MNFCVDEYSRTKLQENQNIINTLMNRVRELQCEMNYTHDPFSYISSESALFLFSKMNEEDWPYIWHTLCTSGMFLQVYL